MKRDVATGCVNFFAHSSENGFKPPASNHQNAGLNSRELVTDATRSLDIGEIPTVVQNFVRRYITSVWQLELLLFFKRSNRELSINEVSRALYLEPGVVGPAVRSLADAGVLSADSEKEVYKYDPKLSKLADAINEMEKTYNLRRTALINFIYAAPMKRFADAFKLRFDEED